MKDIVFTKETEFKKTEIGEIPRKWEVKRLGEIIEEVKRTPKQIREEEIKIHDVPFLSITRYRGFVPRKEKFKKEIKPKNLIESMKVVKKGEIAYGFPIDEQVIGVLLDYDVAFISKAYYVWRLKKYFTKRIDLMFLNYLLRSKLMLNQYLKYILRTVDRRRILKPSDFIKIPLPLPPLPEQKAIAQVLKDFDDLIEVIEEKIKTLQRIRKGLMEVYFTRGVFEHKEFKDTEIGRIPKEWEVKKVKDVLKFVISANGIKEKEIYKKGKYPVINQGKEFIIGFSDKKELLINNDLPVIVFGDHTCEVKYIDFPFIVGGEGVKLLKPINSLNESYFFYALENFKPKLQHYRRHFKILKDTFIPLPPLEEQKAIAERLKTIDDQIENLKSQKESLQKIKKKFMDLLLTGKVKVKRNEV